jgi:hypothetical protein
MRHILGIAAILTGVASASSAETSFRACTIDGEIGFFVFKEAGDTIEISLLGAYEGPFIRPANSPLLIEIDGDILVFGDRKATLINGDELIQLDCYSMSYNQVTAFNAEASEMAAELERQVQLLQEQAVELRRQINTDLSVENENLQGHLAELLVESAKWRTEANLLRVDLELSARRAAESESEIMLLNAQLVEARRQIDSLHKTIGCIGGLGG